MIHAATVHNPNSQQQEYLAGWQRARAELDNFRKRIHAQRADDQHRASKEVITAFLPLADNFRALVSHLPPDFKNNPWAEGVLHIARQFESELADFGVTPIVAVNLPFDPEQHEAVKTVRGSTVASGHVIEVIQAGYAWRGEVIRPARVKVAA